LLTVLKLKNFLIAVGLVLIVICLFFAIIIGKIAKKKILFEGPVAILKSKKKQIQSF